MNGATLVMAIFTGFVALFTFLLWRATKKYAETTKGLLEQSKDAFEQSKEAFEGQKRALQREAMNRIVSSAVQLDAQFRTGGVQDPNRPNYVSSFASAMLKFLDEADPDTYGKTINILRAWIKTDKGKIYDWIFQGEIDKPGTNINREG